MHFQIFLQISRIKFIKTFNTICTKFNVNFYYSVSNIFQISLKNFKIIFQISYFPNKLSTIWIPWR